MTFVLTLGIGFAYETVLCNGYDRKWNTSSITLESSNISFVSGSSYTTALDFSVDAITDAPANFSINRIGTAGVSRGNGDNETWFSSNPVALAGSPAVAWSWTNCWQFLWWGANDLNEVDVIFDVAVSWTPGTTKSVMTPYGGTLRPFRTTALHELAHLLGLGHEADEYNILGQDWDHIHANGAFANAYLGEDVTDGAVDLYGLSGNNEDLSVSHFKWVGSSAGGYSQHDWTTITDTSGSVVSRSWANGVPTYNVAAGQQVVVEFTFENNGRSSQSGIDIGYYLSTNDTITTFDTRLGGKTMTLGRNDVYNSTKTLTIPSNYNSGTELWIGVIIDEDDSLSEVLESNNATYLAIEIQ